MFHWNQFDNFLENREENNMEPDGSIVKLRTVSWICRTLMKFHVNQSGHFLVKRKS